MTQQASLLFEVVADGFSEGERLSF
jgi:hypothetical protein